MASDDTNNDLEKQVSTQERHPPEPSFARWLRHYGPFGPLFLTPIFLIISVGLATKAYLGQQTYFTGQLEQFRKQARALAYSVNTASLTTLYSHGNDITKAFLEHPELVIFFDKYSRERAGLTEKDLEARYQKADPKTRDQIYNMCVLDADFMEETYARRCLHPAEDWDEWWNSLCDDYDESLALRDFFKTRGPRWYSVHEKLEPIFDQHGGIDVEKTHMKRAKEYRTQRFLNVTDAVSLEPCGDMQRQE